MVGVLEGEERSPSWLEGCVLVFASSLADYGTYWMTTQCLSFPSSFCVEEVQPCSSTLVPEEASALWKKSVMSSVFERRRCRVGRSTAMEPPWLVREEVPLHILTIFFSCGE